MPPVLQSRLPFDPAARPLPGVAPLDMADWLIVDEAYAGQMALREDLLATRASTVFAADAASLPARREILAMILDRLEQMPGFDIASGRVTCPDGRVVPLDGTEPLSTAARLVQEDICLMEKRAGWDEHVLTAAVLCFPASWTLSEKIGRPLIGIHDPVAEYDADIAKRVQRLFDGVRPGRPLWRFNALWYAEPDLHQPRSENARRAERGATSARYFRSERQSVLRLPQSDAVAFTIHTFVIAAADMPGSRRTASQTESD